MASVPLAVLRPPPPVEFLYAAAGAAAPPDAPRFGCGLLFACEQIESTASPRERVQLVSAEVRRLGFDWLGFGHVCAADGSVRPLGFAADLAHPRWVQAYFEHRYAACDPRLAAFGRSNLPYVWDLERLAADGRAAGADAALLQGFLDGLDRHGLHSGVFFGVPRRGTARRCFVSLAAARRDSNWIDDRCLGAALTLGLAAASVLGELPEYVAAPKEADAPPALSGLQREIVTCLRAGMSDKQIAYALNVTRYNVDYHMRQLRRRFAARNRVQLAQRVLQAADGL